MVRKLARKLKITRHREEQECLADMNNISEWMDNIREWTRGKCNGANIEWIRVDRGCRDNKPTGRKSIRKDGNLTPGKLDQAVSLPR